MMLTISEAAERLGCSTWTVRDLVRRGEIRHHRQTTRGTIRFKPEWIEEYIAKGMVAPTPRRQHNTQPKKKSPTNGFSVSYFQ